MLWVVVPVVVVASAMGFAFREAVAGELSMWLGLTIPYAALTGVALYRMMDEGTLLDRFRLKAGDITLGALLAALLLGAAWLGQHVVLSPDSARVGWAFRLLLQLGRLGGSPLVLIAIVAIGVMEEIVWRGLVLDALAERLGTSRAWPAAAVAYAAAHLPTLFTLRDVEAGPNPLLVSAALGAGLFWGLVASRLGRLPPVIISHAVFGTFAPALLLPAILS